MVVVARHILHLYGVVARVGAGGNFVAPAFAVKAVLHSVAGGQLARRVDERLRMAGIGQVVDRRGLLVVRRVRGGFGNVHRNVIAVEVLVVVVARHILHLHGVIARVLAFGKLSCPGHAVVRAVQHIVVAVGQLARRGDERMRMAVIGQGAVRRGSLCRGQSRSGLGDGDGDGRIRRTFIVVVVACRSRCYNDVIGSCGGVRRDGQRCAVEGKIVAARLAADRIADIALSVRRRRKRRGLRVGAEGLIHGLVAVAQRIRSFGAGKQCFRLGDIRGQNGNLASGTNASEGAIDITAAVRAAIAIDIARIIGRVAGRPQPPPGIPIVHIKALTLRIICSLCDPVTV